MIGRLVRPLFRAPDEAQVARTAAESIPSVGAIKPLSLSLRCNRLSI